MTKLMAILAKHALTILLSVALLGVFVFNKYNTKDTTSQLKSLKAAHSKMDADYKDLEARYNNLEADRKHVLTQTKILLQERVKFTETQEANAALKKELESRSRKVKELASNVELLSAIRSEHQEMLDNKVAAYRHLDERYKQLDSQSRVLDNALKSKVESSPQYKKLMDEMDSVKKERSDQHKMIQALQNKIKQMNGQYKKLANEFKKNQDRNMRLSKQNHRSMQELKELKAQKTQILQKEKVLNKTVDDLPKRFKEMAAQNKTLLKETADMHYNLGVFYTQNRNYMLGVKEFKRALDFNPNNPKIHYNLGYLYAEEFGQHELAMTHFQRFLESNPKGKESEMVRSYLLEHQVYGDKPDRVKIR